MFHIIFVLLNSPVEVIFCIFKAQMSKMLTIELHEDYFRVIFSADEAETEFSVYTTFHLLRLLADVRTDDA